MAFRLIEKLAHRIAGLEQSIAAKKQPPTADSDRPLPHSDETAKRSALGTGMGRQYRAGEVIYHQGDRGDCMYVVDGGSVEIVRREGEEEFCLGILGDGDFFGEVALFDEEVRPATVRALEDVYIFTMERNFLLRRIHEDPSMVFQLVENLALRITTLERSLIRHARVPSG